MSAHSKTLRKGYGRVAVAVILVLFATLQGRSQIINFGNNPSAGKFYPINGFKMYCEIYGTGKPLLMIHGNNGSISSFSKTIPYFSAKYQVIVADSRAQGKSADPVDTLSFEMMADDYAALLTTLHVDSCYVLGWSDGGIVALLLAMRHPDKVKQLASTGANLWPDSSAIIPSLWKEELAAYKRYKANPYITNEQRNDKKLFMLDWFQPHITLKSLHKIKCPSLIISGDRDLIELTHTVLIYQNIRKGYLWVLPHSGHGTLSEHTAEFNKKVDDFFTTAYR